MQIQRSCWRVSSGSHDPAAVERLLRLLPGWFGIEPAIAAYVESARHLPTYLAWPQPGSAGEGGGNLDPNSAKPEPGHATPSPSPTVEPERVAPSPSPTAADPERVAPSPSPTAADPERVTPRPSAGAADPEPVGVLLAARHFPAAAEIHLMAVHPSRHRHGVGRALVAALEVDLIADGVKFLQVKTLGPTSPDEGYARTREFYARVGFQPLEELHELWPGNPCVIMIKSLP
jgi:ribosomal protein S18 acetylase RimI-like enzyme